MRTRVVVLSAVSAIATALLSGGVNAFTGLPLDVPPPYNSPVRVIPTLIGAIPGVALGLVAGGYALHDAARRTGIGWFIGLLIWPFGPLLASGLMLAGVIGYATLWFLALAFVPLAALVYGILAPSETASPPSPASRSRLAVFIGALVVAAVGGAALLLSGAHSKSVNTPSGPALRVTQSVAVANCAAGVYPSMTVTNISPQTVAWTANPQASAVTITPSSGSLPPGASVSVTLTGATSGPSIIVQFQASDGASTVAKFGCQQGTSK